VSLWGHHRPRRTRSRSPRSDPPVADDLLRILARPAAALVGGVVERTAIAQLAQLLDRRDDLGLVEPHIVRGLIQQIDPLRLEHRDQRHDPARHIPEAVGITGPTALLADLLRGAEQVVPGPVRFRLRQVSELEQFFVIGQNLRVQVAREQPCPAFHAVLLKRAGVEVLALERRVSVHQRLEIDQQAAAERLGRDVDTPRRGGIRAGDDAAYHVQRVILAGGVLDVHQVVQRHDHDFDGGVVGHELFR
jgi:hypothetical protein